MYGEIYLPTYLKFTLTPCIIGTKMRYTQLQGVKNEGFGGVC